MTVERILEILKEEENKKLELCGLFEDDEEFKSLYKQYLHEWGEVHTIMYLIKKEMEGGE